MPFSKNLAIPNILYTRHNHSTSDETSKLLLVVHLSYLNATLLVAYVENAYRIGNQAK